MENNQQYFHRLIPEGGRLNRDTEREYPLQVYQFGNSEMQFFMYEKEGYHVAEKTTGLYVACGADMDLAQKATYQVIETYGGPDKFIALIKDTLDKLSQGMEYDYINKEWVDPSKVEIIAPEAPTGADE